MAAFCQQRFRQQLVLELGLSGPCWQHRGLQRLHLLHFEKHDVLLTGFATSRNGRALTAHHSGHYTYPKQCQMTGFNVGFICCIRRIARVISRVATKPGYFSFVLTGSANWSLLFCSKQDASPPVITSFSCSNPCCGVCVRTPVTGAHPWRPALPPAGSAAASITQMLNRCGCVVPVLCASTPSAQPCVLGLCPCSLPKPSQLQFDGYGNN